jgi:hypothetical protein
MSFTVGYEPIESQEMMTLSAIAYAGEDTNDYQQIKQAIETEIANSASLGGNFTLVWLGISPDLANLVYVARDSRAAARFAVVARGSDWDFLEDWVDDFDVICTHDWPTAIPANPAIYVAQGSWDGLQALLSATSNVFDPTQPSYSPPTPLAPFLQAQAIQGADSTDLDLYVTGHSLGGAMATVLGLWLADTAATWGLLANKVNFKTYTFASPTVGNQAFVNYYNGQTANQQSQWQAFRVYNEQDAVPFAYANLIGVPGDGVPLTFDFTLELTALLAGINAALLLAGVSYVQVESVSGGTALGLNNHPPSPQWPPSCNDPAGDWSDFGCWVGYEHDHNTYLFLLGAATVDIPQRAIDVRSISVTSLRILARSAVKPKPAP